VPVETATYIADLVPANPLTTDGINQGDDHLRLVKQVLKNTLPNATAAIAAPQVDLDHGYVPIGGIVLWSGSIVSIPAHWHICDGTSGTPDLRDRFVLGAGGSSAPGVTGGSGTTTTDGAHTHTGATGGHALTLTELPNDLVAGAANGVVSKSGLDQVAAAHTHPISSDGGHSHSFTPPFYALAYIQRIS
jgi:hypothetical protein